MKRVLAFAVGGVFMMAVAGANAQTTTTTTLARCFDGGTNPPACTANCPGANPTTCSPDDSGCVSDTKAHKTCSAAIGGLFCKMVSCVLGCHKKQADARFKGVDATTADTAEDACEGSNTSPATEKSCGGKLNAGLAKLAGKGICDPQQLSNANAEEAVLIGHPSPVPSASLDGQNGRAYCDSTSGAMIGGDDNGTAGGGGTAWVPATKAILACEDAVTKNNGKLVCCVIKCHSKMNSAFFAGKPFDEEACEETNAKGNACHDKFTKQATKNIGKGICPPCLQAAGWEGNAANAIGTVDGANVLVYPCF